MVEYMQTFVIAANKQGVPFPQNVEEGYNVMKEMQQVLHRVSKGLMFCSDRATGIPEHRSNGQG